MGAILFCGSEVLLVERGREPLKGYWSLPGGVVEAGETLAAAVRREVAEETGLHVEPEFIAEIFERILRDAGGRPEYHYVLVDYVCRVTGGHLAAQDDASRVAWIPLARLGEYQITEGTTPVIERAFRMFQGEDRPTLPSRAEGPC